MRYESAIVNLFRNVVSILDCSLLCTVTNGNETKQHTAHFSIRCDPHIQKHSIALEFGLARTNYLFL